MILQETALRDSISRRVAEPSFEGLKLKDAFF
jgi:hypothetical protein